MKKTIRNILISGMVLLLMLGLGKMPAAAEGAFTIDGDNEWTQAYPMNGQNDYLQDQQTGSGTVSQDIAGSVDYHSVYMHLTSTDLAFRVRVNDIDGGTDPSTYQFKNFIFVGIDADVNGSIDFFMGLYNPLGNNGRLGIYQSNPTYANDGPSSTGIDGKPFVAYAPELNVNYNIKQSESSINGDPDYYISFSFSMADITTAFAQNGYVFNSTTPFRFMTGTASQDNSFNQDLNGMDRTGWSSTGTWSSLGVYSNTVTAAEGGFNSLYHTVVFDKNTGDSAPVPDAKTVATNTELGTLPDSSLMTKKGGFIFQGWNTMPDGSGEVVDENTVITGDMTVYAMWSTSAILQVTFDPNNGNWSGSTTNQTVDTINGIVGGNMPVDPTRTGYEFQGWTIVRDNNTNTFDSSTPVTQNITVYAYWVPTGSKKVPVKFFSNDGNVLLASVYPNGASSNYSAPTPLPTRTGYTLSGWSTTPNSSTVDKAVSFKIGSNPTVFSYYAVWTKASTTYNLTFNPNGGTLNDISSRTVTDGLFGTMPLAPSRDGYEFIEWNRNPDGTGEVMYPTSAITGATTVYAIWRPSQQITFHANDGTANTEEISSVDYRLSYLPQAPQREGYTFMGWSTDGGENNTVNADLMNLGSNVDLYAVWDPIYEVIFDANSGSFGSTTTTSVPTAYGSVLYIPESPALDYYVHTGWNTEPDGNGTSFDLSTPVTGNTTVYAMWEPKSFTVAFDANGGGYSDLTTSKNVDESYNTLYKLPTETPVRDLFTFASWNTEPDGSGDTVTAEAYYLDPSITTIYALWTPVGQVTISYLSDNVAHGTVSRSNETLDPVEGTPAGSIATANTNYHFVKWIDEEGNTISTESTFVPAKNPLTEEYEEATYKAVFEADSYTIEYVLDGGTNSDHNPATYSYGDRIIFHDPVRENYRFNGWYDDLGNKITEISPTDTGNKKVTARWTRIYQVTYETNGGSDVPAENVPDGERIPLIPEDPDKTGYDFQGWYKDDGTFLLPFDFESDVITGDQTIYAKWLPRSDTPYKVEHYKLDMETGTYDLSDTENFKGTTGTEVSAVIKSYKGYKEDTSHADRFVTADIAADGSLTLKVYYTLNIKNVIFNSNLGAYDDESTEKEIDQIFEYQFNLPDNPPTREGFTFGGWNTKDDGSGTDITSETNLDDESITTIYAI